MVRHLLAPVFPAAAAALDVPRTIAPPPAPEPPGGTRPDPAVAITFDDGPHPEGTPAVLEVLARAGARATFFLVGEQVERRPALAAEIVAAGHAVALHGYRHRLQLRISAADVDDDVRHGLEVVQDAAGTAVRWHRPPYGVYSAAGLRAARAAGLHPLLWSRWGKDWRKFTTPARIAACAAKDVSAGDVILLHDADFYSARQSHRRTVEALPLVLAELSAAGIGTFLLV